MSNTQQQDITTTVALRYDYTDPFTGEVSVEEGVATYDESINMYIHTDAYGCDRYFSLDSTSIVRDDAPQVDEPVPEYPTNCDECIAAHHRCSFDGHTCHIHRQQ